MAALTHHDEAWRQRRMEEIDQEISRLELEKECLMQRHKNEKNGRHDSSGKAPLIPSSEKSFQQLTIDSLRPLSMAEIERYSRQLLLGRQDGVGGMPGQARLLHSHVLVVGAGGIGSSLLLYLAAAGVGHLTIVDYDAVDVSNLHRQILHDTPNTGVNKAESARRKLLLLNPTIQVTAVSQVLTHDNVLSLLQGVDLVVDASDNAKTRYLINDACVLSGIPLVSGSAIGTSGQVTVYNYHGSCCYRCMYPQPEATAGCASCSDAGVLGPVPGMVGVLQAVEALKLLTGTGQVLHDRMLLYDAMAAGSFMKIRKPPRRADCPVCGDTPTICSMEQSRDNLQQARGPANAGTACPAPLPPSNSVSCREYSQARIQSSTLIDVRVPAQFEMCHLPGAVNIPLGDIVATPQEQVTRIRELSKDDKTVYILCRRGIASAEATRVLLANNSSAAIKVCNVTGGLKAWHEQVDANFPNY